uniref:Uncharacterized protein n=1 Tax=Candidatus Kentrum sp. FW TaxID=2126338 RepID=A0A450T4F7_9GAMM|nr:MAG: hypothetical protein BECKFW1821B_GA0114236_10662 [Candidatus Kentron sp. FW]
MREKYRKSGRATRAEEGSGLSFFPALLHGTQLMQLCRNCYGKRKDLTPPPSPVRIPVIRDYLLIRLLGILDRPAADRKNVSRYHLHDKIFEKAFEKAFEKTL